MAIFVQHRTVRESQGVPAACRDCSRVHYCTSGVQTVPLKDKENKHCKSFRVAGFKTKTVKGCIVLQGGCCVQRQDDWRVRCVYSVVSVV